MDNRRADWQPIELRVYPLQQTAQPEEFNIGVFSTSMFLGMMFILIPVSLAVDMVYDREVRDYEFFGNANQTVSRVKE